MRPSLDPVALRRVVERQESSRVVLDLIISGPRRAGLEFGTSHAAAAEYCSLASLLDLGRRHTPPDLTVPGSSGGFAALRSPSFLCIAPLSLVHERPWCVSDLQLRDPARETARDVDTRRSRARRWSRSLPEILLLWTPGDSGFVFLVCSRAAAALHTHPLGARTQILLQLRHRSHRALVIAVALLARPLSHTSDPGAAAPRRGGCWESIQTARQRLGPDQRSPSATYWATLLRTACCALLRGDVSSQERKLRYYGSGNHGPSHARLATPCFRIGQSGTWHAP